MTIKYASLLLLAVLAQYGLSSAADCTSVIKLDKQAGTINYPRLPITVVDNVGGCSVLVNINQVWKTDGTISWIAARFWDADQGKTVCPTKNEVASGTVDYSSGSVETSGYSYTQTLNAKCVNGFASIEVYVRDSSEAFASQSSSIWIPPECERSGNIGNVIGYNFTVSCCGDCSGATTERKLVSKITPVSKPIPTLPPTRKPTAAPANNPCPSNVTLVKQAGTMSYASIPVTVVQNNCSAVVFQIKQVWKSTTIDWIATRFDDANQKKQVCPKKSSVASGFVDYSTGILETDGYTYTQTLTASCVNNVANIEVYVHDGSFAREDPSIWVPPACHPSNDVGRKIGYNFTVTCGCDCAGSDTPKRHRLLQEKDLETLFKVLDRDGNDQLDKQEFELLYFFL